MRHQVKGRKLKRTSTHRNAMMRNMVTSLLENERIETTEAKAKELRGAAERIITLGKRGSLHARRQALKVVRSETVLKKVFDELGPRYKDRPGGYTRVIKLGPRLGDSAPMSVIELVKEPVKAKGKPARRRRRRARPKSEAATTMETTEEKEQPEEEAESKTEKSAAAKKAQEKKSEEKKPAQKKTAAKETTEKKSEKKTSEKKSPEKKTSAKKTAEKKTTGKKSSEKSESEKKPAKKSASKTKKKTTETSDKNKKK